MNSLYSTQYKLYPDLLKIIYDYSLSSWWILLLDNDDLFYNDILSNHDVDKDSNGFFELLEIYPEYTTNKRIQDYLNKLIRLYRNKVIGTSEAIKEALFILKRQPKDIRELQFVISSRYRESQSEELEEVD